jgi:hypothetical protein
LSLKLPTWRNFTVCGAVPDPPESPKPPAAPDPPSGSAAAGNEGNPQAKIAALTEEKERHYTARQQAEAKAAEQETKLNELLAEKEERERATLSEAEKTARDLEDTKQANETLAQTNRRLSIQNAFLLQNDVQWHNPEHALSLVDLSQVETEKDGTIKNPDVLKAAITDLAKKNAYLVKDATPPEKKVPPPGSGAPPQGDPPATNGLDADTLRRRFPALRSH